MLRAFNVRNVPGPVFQAVKFGPVVGVPHNYLTEGLFGGVWGGFGEGLRWFLMIRAGAWLKKSNLLQILRHFFWEFGGVKGGKHEQKCTFPSS